MACDSDLTDQQWSIIGPLLPVNRGGGRRVELDLRMALNAMFYLVRTGSQWRYLPKDFPKWQSVYYFSFMNALPVVSLKA